MRTYVAKEDEEFIDTIINMIEQDTDKKIFTLRVLDSTPEALEVLIVFDDKEILNGVIKVLDGEGEMAIRIQGNFI
jgi:hypothetical protein